MNPILLTGYLDDIKEELLSYLTQENYMVMDTESIDEGTKVLEEDSVDIVIVPFESNEEFRGLSSIYSPILLILSLEDIDTMSLGPFKGIVEFLFLPLSKRELRARIEHLKKGREREDTVKEYMMEDMIHHLEDVVYSSTLDGHLLYLNSYARREYGASIESFITRRLAFLKNIILEIGYNRSEYSLETEKGLRYLEEKTYLVKDREGTPLRIDGLVYDITELKYTEKALRHGEAKMRSIITVIPDTLIRFQRDGMIKEIWAQDIRVVSLFPPHYKDKNVEEVFSEEMAHLFLENIEKAIIEKDLQHFEYTITTPSHYIFEVRIVASSKDETVAILRDITAYREAQNSLLRFRAAMDSSGDMIFLIDYHTGQFLDVNNTVVHMLGYSKAEILSMGLVEIQTSISTKDMNSFFSYLKEEKRRREQETFYDKKDGNSTPVEVSYMYLEISGKPMIIASARDITSRIKLQKERDRLFNLSLDMMCIFNEEGLFNQVNPAWNTIMGWREEDLVNRSLLDFIHPEDKKKTQDKLLQLSWGLPVKDLENRYRCWDGAYKWLSWSLFPVKEEGIIVCVAKDISRRIEDQERLRRYTKELEVAKDKVEGVQTRLRENLSKAGELHQKFLPHLLPQVKGLTFATYYHPAERIGGDFFNIISLEEQLLLYIADVSGHGLDGAILTIFMRETINNYLAVYNREESLSPKSLLYFLSEKFRGEDFPEDYFISLYLFVLDLKSFRLVFSNAGLHIAPILVDSHGQVRSLMVPGLPISRAIDTEYILYQEDDVILSPGETLFTTTDGLIEQSDGTKPYGEKRILQLLQSFYSYGPEELVEEIKKDFIRFNGDQQGDDDISFFVMKRDEI